MGPIVIPNTTKQHPVSNVIVLTLWPCVSINFY